MLEYYIESTERIERFRRRPLGPYIESLAAKLHEGAYTHKMGCRILGVAGRFNDYVRSKGIEDSGEVGADLVERFISEALRSRCITLQTESAFQHCVKHLQEEGIVPEMVVEAAEDPFGGILCRYDSHLRDLRGFSPLTRPRYLHNAKLLLDWYHDRRGKQPLTDLTGVDILDFITEQADLHPSGPWRKHLCSVTRSFLRYLFWEGTVEVDLSRVVPTVPYWRLQSIPRHLPWEDVRALIESVDSSTPIGLRDKAVLVLIATLGLRSQEVCRLCLDDIRWRDSEIRLTQTKGRREHVLPLPQEVGEAISEYLIHGRPQTNLPNVFLKHQAPQGPISSAGKIVRKHLLRAKITAPSYGAHLLRHSLATRMVNQGAAIKQIADVLGHQSINTTAIYTKVDTRHLAEVALPFPGSGS